MHVEQSTECATIQGWDGVEDVLWIDFTLFVRFFFRYYVATIPKSRLDSFLYIGVQHVSKVAEVLWCDYLCQLVFS